MHAARENGIEAIGISLDSLQRTVAYLKEEAIDFPMYVPRNIGDYVRQNKLFGVPRTVLRDSLGIARRVWTGLLTESDINDIIHTIINNKVIIKKGDKP